MSTNYSSRYIHQIAGAGPRRGYDDKGKDIRLSAESLTSPKLLAKALRDGGAMQSGERVSEFRVGKDGVISVFRSVPGQMTPSNIVLTPK